MNAFAPVLLALLAVVAALLILQPRSQVVPEQERLVIFRLGRFHRISGPGLVWRFARIETIEYRYNTAKQPRNLWVPNLLIHGIEVSLNVNLWIRTDLVAVAGGNASRLAEMALLRESAREAQVAVEVKRAVDDGLATVAAADALPPNPTLLQKIAVLLPGSASCEELLTYLRRELATRLWDFGVILDPAKRISVTQVFLPDDVVEVLRRARLLDSLGQQLPELSPDMRSQVAASIEGREPLNIQELVVKSQGGVAGVVRELVTLKDGSLVDVALAPGAAQNDTATPNLPAASPAPAAPAEELSREDLQVLRSVPRNGGEAPKKAA